MFSEHSKLGDLHSKIVNEVLPHFADELKREGIISAYDRKRFMIPLADNWPPIEINPDLVLHVSDKGKVLVEIANPRDAKRFIGEVIYPHVLGHFGKIAAAIVFVLHPSKRTQAPERGMVQNMVLHLIWEKKIPTILFTWPQSEDTAYHNLKTALTRLFPKKS